MKILITGADGFVGSHLVKFFKNQGHEVLGGNRHSLDLLNDSHLRIYTFGKYDMAIHCAAVGLKGGTYFDYMTNMKMLCGFRDITHNTTHSFVIGSGAEFGRNRNVYARNTPSFDAKPPEDYYGLFKQQQSMITKNWNDFTNIRLFGCFGAKELKTRLSHKAFSEKKVVIEQNKFMDFFYVGHLGPMILDIFNNIDRNMSNTFNACYKMKYNLEDFVRMIFQEKGEDGELEVGNNTSSGYCGESNKFSEKYNLKEGIKAYVRGKNEEMRRL